MQHKWAVVSVWAWNVKPEIASSPGIGRQAKRRTAMVIVRTCQRSRNVVWNHCCLFFCLSSDSHTTHNLRLRHSLLICYTCSHTLYVMFAHSLVLHSLPPILIKPKERLLVVYVYPFKFENWIPLHLEALYFASHMFLNIIIYLSQQILWTLFSFFLNTHWESNTKKFKWTKV